MRKKGGVNYFCHPQLFKVGRVIAPSSFVHEVVLVKLELQTHMEHLTREFMSVRSFSGVCVAQSSVFSVFVIPNAAKGEEWGMWILTLGWQR